MQNADAGLIGCWIEFVVIDERRYLATTVGVAAEQEGARLVLPLGSAVQLAD